MKIQLRFFASLRETLGVSEEPWQTEATTVQALRAELCGRGAAFAEVLAPSQPVRVALNHTMVDESTALIEGCEVAFFPPVTGG
jgi:sulfur-carrier protein